MMITKDNALNVLVCSMAGEHLQKYLKDVLDENTPLRNLHRQPHFFMSTVR